MVPFIATWLSADLFGGAWRPVFFIMAIPGVIGIFILWKFIEDNPKKVLEQGRMKKEEYDLITSSVGHIDGTQHYSSKVFTRDAQFYIFTSAFFFMNMIGWGITVWVSVFLVKQHGFNIKAMGLLAGVPYVASFIAMNLGALTSAKLCKGRSKPVILVSFLTNIPALLFIGNVGQGQTPLIILGLFLTGLSFNFNHGAIYAYPSLRYPKELVGRVMGVANAVGQMGGFFSPLLAGYLVITRPDASYDFKYVFLFWAVASLVAFCILCFLRESSIEEEKGLGANAAAQA